MRICAAVAGPDFQPAMKWSFVPLGKNAPNPTYLVVNADEMEPGTFKDRLLMERNPHQLIEGAIVAGFAIEADFAYIFLRGEYTLAADRISRAIAEAYERHYLGRTSWVPATAWNFICISAVAVIFAGKRPGC